jgi:hypothetical protein
MAEVAWQPYDAPAKPGRWDNAYIKGATVRTRAVQKDGSTYIARLSWSWSFCLVVFTGARLTQDILYQHGAVAEVPMPKRARLSGWRGILPRANRALLAAGYTPI